MAAMSPEVAIRFHGVSYVCLMFDSRIWMYIHLLIIYNLHVIYLVGIKCSPVIRYHLCCQGPLSTAYEGPKLSLAIEVVSDSGDNGDSTLIFIFSIRKCVIH